MTNKITMPEPVAYPSDDWVETFFGLADESGFYVFRGDFGNIADRFRIAAKCAGFITTTQAEAYANARVKRVLEESTAIAERKAVVGVMRSLEATHKAEIAKEIAAAIRALIPKD